MEKKEREMYVYHGSSKYFRIAKPQLNIRTSNRKVIWKDISFHATPHKYIALSYLYDKRKTFFFKSKKYYFGVGVSLYQKHKSIAVYGKKSLAYSLQRLFHNNKPRYLYIFNKKYFFHKKGLGPLEVATLKEIKPIKIIRIKDPIWEIKKQKVKFLFVDLTKPEEIEERRTFLVKK